MLSTCARLERLQPTCSEPLECTDSLIGRCADTVPMALRMAMGKAFPQGPFKLGILQPVINAGAIIYMVVSVVRPLPLTYPPACGPLASHSFLAV